MPYDMDGSFLQLAFDATGPYATVCADVSHTTENADAELELRVRALAERLTEQGAPEAVVEAVRERLLEGNDGGHLIVSMDEGGRAAGADREPVQRRAAEPVAEHEARDIAQAAEQVEAAAAHGLSVTGTEAVVEALRKGQVETLLLADEAGDETLLVGGSPLEHGIDQRDMDALGVHGEAVPAERAMLAAAVTSRAAVVVLPRAAIPGRAPVAAVLRYTDASTQSA